MRKSTFPKFAATLFFVLSIHFSCEKEEPLVLETDQDVNAKAGPYTLNSVDMEGIPKITDFLSSRAGKDIFKASATGKNDGPTIAEEVIRVNDSLGQSNYSFHFTLPDSAENEFYNLVVGESEDGQPQEPMVFHYVCDPEHYEAFEESGFDPTAFVGTMSMYPFDQIFSDGSLSKDICVEHDQYGDPIPCIRTNVTNGSGGGGTGTSMGGAQFSSGFDSPTVASYSISITVYHVTPDGRTFSYGSGSVCQHPGECQVIYEMSTKANNKATDRGCTKCPSAPGGVAANMASRTKLLVNGLRTKLTLSTNEINFLLRNGQLTQGLTSFLAKNKSATAKAYARFILVGIMNGNNVNFGQDYRGQMSSSEIIIFNSLSIFEQMAYLFNAQKATWKAQDLYPNSLYNGKGDAFRHAYFNALNAILLGPSLAEDLATAHEDKPFDYSNHYKEKQMDLFNNQVGRTKKDWLADGYQSLPASILDAMAKGELRYLSNLQGGGASGPATNQSKLIPTN
ncbi:DUF6973 domain-containing protein [Muricauda sp. MAR_2010_75]|uniref:DUF6973 domain-containing protein n=1 Tax=Allomuricauda sp. MAR_2010_75 TaxID=1250232 RepID=UPI000692473A|nr:hypothetical protein [Muricauda sp. MAR_2010_75]